MSFPRYPAYKNGTSTVLERVPAHWSITPIKRFARLTYGAALPSEARSDNGFVPVYGSNGPVGVHNCANTDSPVIIVGRKGSYGAINWCEEPLFAIDTTYYIDKTCATSNLRWLFWALQAVNLNGFSQDTGVPGLARELVHDMLCTYPTPPEQNAIAKFLDRETDKIDALVAEQERLITLLKEKRQAVISQAVTKGLDPDAPMKPSGVEWLGEVPANWNVVPLRRDLHFLTSGSRGWADFYSEEGALFIRIGNLTRDSLRLDLSNIQRVAPPASAEGTRTQVRAGDILFSITAFMGSVAVVPNDFEEAYVSQHVALARIRGDALLPKWVGYLTLSSMGQAYLDAQCYGGTKVQLSLEDVANLPITVPPLTQQQEIVSLLEDIVSEIDDLLREQERLRFLLQERRAALISAAVTGKIDVRNYVEPAAEPAIAA